MGEDQLLFSERFKTIPWESAPAYYELVLVVSIIVTLIGAVVFASVSGEQRTQVLMSLTPRRTSLKSFNHDSIPVWKLLLMTLVGVFYATALLTLLRVGASASTTEYWSEVGVSALWIVGSLVASMLLIGWYWSSLFGKDSFKMWIRGYYLFSLLFALSLVFPLFLVLISAVSSKTVLWISGALFILYRLLVIWLSVRIFPASLSSPLHLILYLCAFEIGPIYLMVR